MKFLLALLLLLPLSENVYAADPAFAFFYGDDPPWAELQAFDIVVVDPGHVPDPAVAALSHTRLAAYVSVGEVNPSRSYARQIPQSWLTGENRNWGSKLIDQSQPGWPAFFAGTVIAPLWQAGYRDFFLDTLDSYQLFAKTPEDRQKQETGLVAVINEIKQRYPEARLIFNRGFEILDRTHDKVYAVAAESLYQKYDSGNASYKEVSAADHDWLLGELDKIHRTYRLPVICIDYVPPSQRELARETARKIEALGFIPWVATPDLASIGIGQVEVMPRRVLIVHSSPQKEADLREMPALRFAALPLNYLGYVPEFVDVAQLPDKLIPGRYAGVIVWLSEQDAPGDLWTLSSWLDKLRPQGIPFAILGQVGFVFDTPLWKSLGIQRGNVPASTAEVRVLLQSSMMGFESQPRPQPYDFNSVKLTEGESLLTLARGDERQVAAAITPWGGYAMYPYAVTTLPTGDDSRWVINPFDFFRAALRLPDMPVPDATTESGRRMLLVHMDGDGFANRSELHGKPFSGEAVLSRIVRKYPLPMTISVIEAELSPTGFYPQSSAYLEGVAREIFGAPNVEMASHSYSHPYIWSAWGGSRAKARPRSPEREDYHVPIPGYSFNLQREIEGSIRYIETRLAPKGKKVAVFLWSGECDPDPDALEWTDRLGVQNMNGGDTVATHSHPSLTLVAGLGLGYGNHFQVFAPNQNENIYTNRWNSLFYGYERVTETFEITETPRRLKPMDIYFHAYIASRRAGLQSLDKVFAYAQAQNPAPVFASEYARKVRDFQQVAVARTARGWRIRGTNALRTLRAPARFGEPDAGASIGVAGFNKTNGETYIHLADGADEILFSHAQNTEPLLVSANASLGGGSRSNGMAQWQLAGHVPLQFELANVENCKVTFNGKSLTPHRRDGAGFRYQLTSDAAGTIKALCRN